MEDKIYFSVVIPLYNKEKYIKKTINSVLEQSFKNFELIIVDDGSTDRSIEIVKSINDQRINLIIQENSGPSKARNRGISEAKGEFIAFLDADDEWLPKKLERQYKFHYKHIDIFWSCCGFSVDGGKRKEIISYACQEVCDNALISIINGLSITSSTVVIKRSLFINNRLLFNEAYKRSEDREVWYKIASLYPAIGYIPNIEVIIYANTMGSLNATGLEEQDFSYLTMKERIENELNVVDPQTKDRFNKFLDKWIILQMLTMWGWTSVFNKESSHFIPYVNYKIIIILRILNFLPLLVKKVLVKIYQKFRGKV